MKENTTEKHFMQTAIKWAKKSIKKGGGPFGAVIVKDGEIIAQSHNTVTIDKDPSAHAEVNAIRQACKTLNTFNLEDCIIYSSCEPCPMCLSAIYWAGIKHIYYGCTKEDAKEINFDDSFIYKEIALEPSQRKIPAKQMMHDEAIQAFKMWEETENKTEY